MQLRILAVLAALAAGASAPAAAQQPDQGRQTTITGEVIDLSCRLGQGLGGESHRMCAHVCADRGIPLAILGSDGNVYLPISAAMPGDAQNARLREHAEHRVRVTGRVVNRNGARAIFIDSVAMAAGRI